MNRRGFIVAGCGAVAALAGCRSTQTGTVLKDGQADMVGSHAAGAETYKPLIEESLGKLLGRQSAPAIQQAGGAAGGAKKVCFVGLENKSSEELGDFKEHIIETIDNKINASGAFVQISRRFTDAGLRQLRLRPDELFLPANQRQFLAVMESQGQPFDYLLFATVTSGTTRDNASAQKDYMLTLELVDIRTGTPDKESACLRKGYTKSRWK
jgi:hypothetical protein